MIRSLGFQPDADRERNEGAGHAPRVSVVVPAVNEAADIGRCLASLAAQECGNSFEVIVVDNNSTDETAAIARALGATVVFEPHAGVCWARQRGTETARGEIVVSTDADTTYDAGWLRRITDAFDREPSSVAVCGPCRWVEGPRWASIYAAALFGIVHLVYRLTGRVVYASATNIAFRKNAWSGYDTRLTQGGDELDLLRRLRGVGEVHFDLGNPTFTSSRRLQRGLLYNVFVTCVFYYLLGYVLNRMFGRTVLGTAPEIRSQPPRRRTRNLRASLVTMAVVLLVMMASRMGVDLA